MIVLGNQPPMSREPHRSLFYLYLENIGLDGLWNAIVAENKAGKLGYHNNEHLFGMAHIARDLAMAEGVESDGSWMKVIVTAALIHDVNHAGSGKRADVDNIREAIRWFDGYVSRLPSDTAESNFFITFGERIKESIKVTEFPFVHQPKNQVEQILRDADLLWSYQREAHRIVNYCLYGEVSEGKGEAIKHEDWFAYNAEFYRTCTFFTASGRRVVDHLRDHLIALIKPSTNNRQPK